MAGMTYRASFEATNYCPLADWAASLEAQIVSARSLCRGCLHNIPASRSSNKVSVGTVAFLPAEISTPFESIIHRQAHVNSGAFAHPVLVLTESRCGHVYFVAPMTSFDGSGIQAKYDRMSPAKKNDTFWRYLAVDKHDQPPHNDLRALATVGDKLHKASYVHLDHGFWVEKEYLAVFGPRQARGTSVTASALSYAQWAYTVAEKHRLSNGIVSIVLPTAWRQQPALRVQSWRTSPALPPVPSSSSWRSQAPAAAPPRSYATHTGRQRPVIPYSEGKNASSWRRS